MNIAKRLFVVVLAAMSIFTISACSKKDKADKADEQVAVVDGQTEQASGEEAAQETKNSDAVAEKVFSMALNTRKAIDKEGDMSVSMSSNMDSSSFSIYGMDYLGNNAVLTDVNYMTYSGSSSIKDNFASMVESNKFMYGEKADIKGSVEQGEFTVYTPLVAAEAPVVPSPQPETAAETPAAEGETVDAAATEAPAVGAIVPDSYVASSPETVVIGALSGNAIVRVSVSANSECGRETLEKYAREMMTAVKTAIGA